MQPYSVLVSFLFPQFSPAKHSRFLNYFSEAEKPKKVFKKNLYIKQDSIIKGEDKRTSILIRNLPLDITKEQLRTILSVSGNINFLFLPFDKKNNTIVGLAFVNYINYKSVNEAFQKFNGSKLDGFEMEKGLEIKYSKIQGKSELSQILTQKRIQ